MIPEKLFGISVYAIWYERHGSMVIFEVSIHLVFFSIQILAESVFYNLLRDQCAMAIENVSLNMDFEVQKEAVLAFKSKRMLPKLFDMFEII